jgi:hypothetical protein
MTAMFTTVDRRVETGDAEAVMPFEVQGPIRDIETIAVGRAIRELARLRRLYGPGRWRKRKGFADVRLPDGAVRRAEVHWYEATGIGRRELKVKRLVE